MRHFQTPRMRVKQLATTATIACLAGSAVLVACGGRAARPTDAALSVPDTVATESTTTEVVETTTVPPTTEPAPTTAAAPVTTVAPRVPVPAPALTDSPEPAPAPPTAPVRTSPPPAGSLRAVANGFVGLDGVWYSSRQWFGVMDSLEGDGTAFNRPCNTNGGTVVLFVELSDGTVRTEQLVTRLGNVSGVGSFGAIIEVGFNGWMFPHPIIMGAKRDGLIYCAFDS